MLMLQFMNNMKKLLLILSICIIVFNSCLVLKIYTPGSEDLEKNSYCQETAIQRKTDTVDIKIINNNKIIIYDSLGNFTVLGNKIK